MGTQMTVVFLTDVRHTFEVATNLVHVQDDAGCFHNVRFLLFNTTAE